MMKFGESDRLNDRTFNTITTVSFHISPVAICPKDPAPIHRGKSHSWKKYLYLLEQL